MRVGFFTKFSALAHGVAPADFEVLDTKWHPQSSFYVISGTLNFKFLTQALDRVTTALAYTAPGLDEKLFPFSADFTHF